MRLRLIAYVVIGTAIAGAMPAAAHDIAPPGTHDGGRLRFSYVHRQDLRHERLADDVLIDGTDADHDGLSDDFENGFGTNAAAKDTDGDGFNDKAEILSGHNPLGGGCIDARAGCFRG